MARKRVLIVAGGILSLAVVAGVVAHHGTPGGVCLARRASIRLGMTQAEVDAVLGGPPGNCATRPLIIMDIETLGDPHGPRSATWRADDGRLDGVFDAKAKVRGVRWLPCCATRAPTLAERVRDWLRSWWP